MAAHRPLGRRVSNVYRWLYYEPLHCARPFRVQRYLPIQQRPDAVVNHTHRLILYLVAKSGVSTIKRMFLESGSRVRIPQADLRAPRYDGYFRFAFVRNPWSRLVSCYRNKVLEQRPERFWRFVNNYPHIPFEKMSFADFVRFVCRVPKDLCDRHFRPQVDLFVEEEVDFIGRFESYADDLRRVIERSRLDDKFLKWCNRKINPSLSGPSCYTDYYDDNSRRLVAEKYRDDVERFGYRFGE